MLLQAEQYLYISLVLIALESQFLVLQFERFEADTQNRQKENALISQGFQKRRTPLFDKIVRKAEFVHMCFRYTIDEHVTAADFCNLFFRLVFTRNLIGRFNQICHDLIELRDVF